MHTVRSALALLLLLAVAVAGCAGAAAPSASPSSPPPTDPPPSQVPSGEPGSQPPDGSVVDPGAGGQPGNPGEPTFVVPKPGTTINPREVAIEALAVELDGRKVTVVASWTSGMEPCYVLDTVAVKQDGNEFIVSITEGTGDPDVMCIQVAQTKSTRIDLGELQPGDYVVAAQGETARVVTFTVS